jgi:ABC-2 type transport system permease protein
MWSSFANLFAYRDLIRYLVGRDLKVRYRRSAIGLMWTMLQPLMMMIIFSVVFSTIFRSSIANYPVYALSGIMFWNFFSQSVISSMNSLRLNARILQKLPVPKAVFPIASVIGGVINLLLALVPLMGLVLLSGRVPTLAVLFVPVAILIAALFTLGAGLLLAPLAVFFTDVVELVGVLLMMLMYMTPVFYPLAIVPERYRWIMRINPIARVLDLFRTPIWDGSVPGARAIAIAAILALVLLAVGAAAFRRSSDRIPFYI